MSRGNRGPALKCQRCRDDRQVCMPRDRARLERDCDRCIHYHYRCGPNLPPSGDRPRGNAADSEEYRRSMGLINLVGPSSNEAYACIFSLGTIAWDYSGFYDAAEPTDSSLVGYEGVVLSASTGQMYRPNLVLFRHWERANYIFAYERFDEMYRAHLRSTNTTEAKRLATEGYIPDVHVGQLEKGSQISSREDIETAASHVLRRGARWSSHVATVGSGEVLLMDDRLYVGVRRAIGDIIKDGTDEGFDQSKADLLLPEGRVPDICFGLSGVSDTLFELTESPKDSDIRRSLTRNITRRFEGVLGRPGPNLQRDPEEKVRIRLDYLMRSIADIFGFSMNFTRARGTLIDAEMSSLFLREQFEILDGGPAQDQDMQDSILTEEPQGSSNPGPTPPGIYADLSPSNYAL